MLALCAKAVHIYAGRLRLAVALGEGVGPRLGIVVFPCSPKVIVAAKGGKANGPAGTVCGEASGPTLVREMR